MCPSIMAIFLNVISFVVVVFFPTHTTSAAHLQSSLDGLRSPISIVGGGSPTSKVCFASSGAGSDLLSGSLPARSSPFSLLSLAPGCLKKYLPPDHGRCVIDRSMQIPDTVSTREVSATRPKFNAKPEQMTAKVVIGRRCH
jgi:hypothetical protein